MDNCFTWKQPKSTCEILPIEESLTQLYESRRGLQIVAEYLDVELKI